MPIKMTVREAIPAFQAIEQLPNIPNGTASYNIGYIGDKLEQHVRRFNKEREKLVRELADGKDAVPEDKMPEFTERIEAMLDAEVEIQREPIRLADVMGDKPEKRPEISPKVMRPLAGRIIVE